MNGSKLRPDAPQIRSIEELTRKSEQIFDALDRGLITAKTGEQLGQQIKQITTLRLRLPLQLMSMLAKYKGNIPIPREPMLRKMLGLPETPTPSDAAQLRGERPALS